MGNYGTEVKLLAVSEPTEEFQREVLDKMGPCLGPAEEAIIEYAGRVCYNAEEALGSKPNWIQNRVRDGHESILEHCSATFYIRASRVFTHELVRHRIASYSQRSQRYVDESEPRYITPPELGKLSLLALQLFQMTMSGCWRAYKDLLAAGVPREIARYVLPNACETQIVVTMNFRELRHFIRLRSSPRALPEMQEVANKVRVICKDLAPQVFADV